MENHRPGCFRGSLVPCQKSCSPCLLIYGKWAVVHKEWMWKVRAVSCEPLSLEINSQGMSQSCAVGKFEKSAANLKLNAYLCWERIVRRPPAVESTVQLSGLEKARSRDTSNKVKKRQAWASGHSTDFSGFWIRSHANTHYLKGQQWKILWDFFVFFF